MNEQKNKAAIVFFVFFYVFVFGKGGFNNVVGNV